MKKTKLVALSMIVLVLAVFLTGCGTTPKQVKEVALLDGYVQYEGDDFNIQYKSDWTTDDTEVSSMTARVFLSPTGLSTINVVKEDLPIKYTLDQYKEASLTNLQKTYTTTEFNEEKVTVNDYEAYRISYTASVGAVTLTVSQTLIVEDKKAFVITFSSNEEGMEEVYHNMENTFVIK